MGREKVHTARGKGQMHVEVDIVTKKGSILMAYIRGCLGDRVNKVVKDVGILHCKLVMAV